MDIIPYLFYMKHFIQLSLLATVLLISSCSRYYYKPNGVNVPQLTKAGQFHLTGTGSISSESDVNGTSTNTMSVTDIQASGSPLNHLGIMAGYSSYNYTTTVPDFASGNVNAKANLAEIGVGGYYAVGGERIKMVVDLYGGVGFGNIQSDIDANVTRMFLQPSIGMRSNWFDVAFAPRLVNLKFSDLNTKGRSMDYLIQQGLYIPGGTTIDGNNYTFFEPSLTMRAGYKFVKVQFQYVLSIPTTAIAWNHSPGRLSFGLHFALEDLLSTMKGNVR